VAGGAPKPASHIPPGNGGSHLQRSGKRKKNPFSRKSSHGLSAVEKLYSQGVARKQTQLQWSFGPRAEEEVLDSDQSHSTMSSRLSSEYDYSQEQLMDETLREVYQELHDATGCSVDTLVCTPAHRETFLIRVREVLGDVPEHALLTRLLYLRKHSKLPRQR
jgi:hypothetical protein